MKLLNHNHEINIPNLTIFFQLLLFIPLGLLFIIQPGLATLLSIMFFIYIFIFVKLETGFHLLILFVPVGSLMMREKFIEKYLPYAHKLHTVDNQNLYHLIFMGVIASLFLRISSGNFKLVPLEIRFRGAILFIFALLATWASFTMLWAPLKVHGAIHLFQLFINISLFFIPLTIIKDEKSLKRAMLVWVSIGFIFAIGSIADRWYAESIKIIKLGGGFEYSRTLSVMDDLKFSFESKINTFRAAGLSRFDNTSNIINITIPLLLYFMASSVATKRLKHLWFQLPTLLLLIFARTLIPNKAGLGAYFLSLSFLILAFKPIRRKYVLWGLMTLICVTIMSFIFAYLVFPDATGVLWLEKTVNLKEGSSTITRWEWWKAATKLVINKTYFLGLGMGGFKYFVEAPHAHSFILSFFFDMGIVGLFCILSLMTIIAFNFYEPVLGQKTNLEIMAFFFAVSIIAFFIEGAVDFEYYMPEHWLFSGTAVAVLNLVYKEKNVKFIQIRQEPK